MTEDELRQCFMQHMQVVPANFKNPRPATGTWGNISLSREEDFEWYLFIVHGRARAGDVYALLIESDALIRTKEKSASQLMIQQLGRIMREPWAFARRRWHADDRAAALLWGAQHPGVEPTDAQMLRMHNGAQPHASGPPHVHAMDGSIYTWFGVACLYTPAGWRLYNAHSIYHGVLRDGAVRWFTSEADAVAAVTPVDPGDGPPRTDLLVHWTTEKAYDDFMFGLRFIAWRNKRRGVRLDSIFAA